MSFIASPSFLIPLIVLSLAVVGWLFWLNYKHIRQWQAAAQTRGWRYRQSIWQRRNYGLAGSTAEGVIWELERVQRNGYYLYRWRTFSCLLPFGSLVILPRAQVATTGERGRTVAIGSDEWQARFVVYTSHDQLAEWIISPEVEKAIRAWPIWPEMGAVERIVWNQNRLEIYGRFQRDWVTLDRMVTFGETLVASLIAARST
ncbi:MAG: hypothetical protein AAF614_33675 [Chloroflexota bacterium]